MINLYDPRSLNECIGDVSLRISERDTQTRSIGVVTCNGRRHRERVRHRDSPETLDSASNSAAVTFAASFSWFSMGGLEHDLSSSSRVRSDAKPRRLPRACSIGAGRFAGRGIHPRGGSAGDTDQSATRANVGLRDRKRAPTDQRSDRGTPAYGRRSRERGPAALPHRRLASRSTRCLCASSTCEGQGCDRVERSARTPLQRMGQDQRRLEAGLRERSDKRDPGRSRRPRAGGDTPLRADRPRAQRQLARETDLGGRHDLRSRENASLRRSNRRPSDGIASAPRDLSESRRVVATEHVRTRPTRRGRADAGNAGSAASRRPRRARQSDRNGRR